MPDYAKTIIYKIVCKDINIRQSYGGHTTHLIKRRQAHKSNCNNINSKKYNYYLYQFIRQNGNWENWEMLWCYDYPCKTKRESEFEERNFIEINKCELNCVKRPYISEEEKKEYDKENHKEYYKNNKDEILEYDKEYRDKNKDKIKEKAKEYYEENKDIILEYHKEYRENNKDKIAEYDKEYREKNKDKIEEKRKKIVICECGSEVRKSGLLAHKKTAKHKKLMDLV